MEDEGSALDAKGGVEGTDADVFKSEATLTMSGDFLESFACTIYWKIKISGKQMQWHYKYNKPR